MMKNYKQSLMVRIIFPLIIFSSFFPSCVMESERPTVRLNIKNSSLEVIDSLCIYQGDSSAKPYDCFGKKDLDNEVVVLLPMCQDKFKIKLLLADSTVLHSETLEHQKNYDVYNIQINKGKVYVTKSIRSSIIHYYKILIYLVLFILLLKVIFIIIKPK